MRQTGLTVLFPKVTSYLSNPERPQFFSQKSAMEGNEKLLHLNFKISLKCCKQLAFVNERYRGAIVYSISSNFRVFPAVCNA